MRIVAFLLALFTLTLVSCDKDKVDAQQNKDLELSFKGFFGADPLVMYASQYAYQGNMNLKFQLFQFYVSDVALLKKNGNNLDTVKLLDIGLVSFKDVQSAAQATAGVRLSLKDVPLGVYSGLYFGIGVSPVLNATSPANYTPPHALDGNYWSWARGYIFSKIEGNAAYDGSSNFSAPLTFHIGENQFYREKTFLQPIEIKETTSQLELQVDLRRVLVATDGNFLDFRQVTQDHTVNKDIARFISDNLSEALSFVPIK